MISKLYKIAIRGGGATGTQSIVHCLSTGEFLPDYPERTPYTGTRFWIATIKTSAYEDPIKFQIWRRRRGIFCFPENMATSFRGIKGLILVYDITRKRTFEELPRWLDTALQYASNFPVAIVGNKVDLIGKTAEERRQYYASEEIIDPRTGILFAESIADEYDVPTLFMETSAKTGHNIQRLFSEFAEMVANHWRKDSI
jgi:GTPase SAR1 family protein